MQGSSAFEIFRPFAVLAAFAFLVGFLSYLALGPTSAAIAHETPSASTFSQPASGPSSQEWNIAKHI